MATPSRGRFAKVTIYNEDETKEEFSLWLNTWSWSTVRDTSPVFSAYSLSPVAMECGPTRMSIQLEGVLDVPAVPKTKAKSKRAKGKNAKRG